VRRIEIVLGKTLANVLAADIATLVVGAVREDVDLDYKWQLYGNVGRRQARPRRRCSGDG